MRILFVAETFPPGSTGGAAISAQELAAELGRQNDVCVFTPSYNQMSGFARTDTASIDIETDSSRKGALFSRNSLSSSR